MKTFLQVLKEDGPDTPSYRTPANFNNANAPLSTHAKTTPDVPNEKEEDLNFPGDHVEENPTNKNSDGKDFPRF